MTKRSVLLLTLVSFLIDVVVRNYPGTVAIGGVSASLYLQGLLLSAMWWWFWLNAGAWIKSQNVRFCLAFVVAAYWSVIVVSDFVHLKYLGQHITAYSLRIAWHDPAYLLGYWNSFGGFFPAAVFLVLVVLSCLALVSGMRRSRPHILGLVIPVLVVGIEVGHLTRNGTEGSLSIEASLLLSHVNAIKMNLGTGPRLHASVRAQVVAVKQENLPQAVVLFVTESFGRHHSRWGQDGPEAMPVFREWLKSRGAFVTTQAFANSSATDMSMPSIFTGLTPDKSSDDFHSVPFVWDYFAAADYRTAWFSSQRFSWGGFSGFFRTKDLDVIESSETMGGTLVNDTGQDDLLTVVKIKEWLSVLPDAQRVFLVVNLNAPHLPCQSSSEILQSAPGETAVETACDKAMRILDQGVMEIIGAVEKRSPNAMFVFTSDHGEFAENPRNVTRIQSYYDEIIRIPFAMVIPNEYAQNNATQMSRLRGNFASRQIMNADIAPTLADLLELGRFRENDSWIAQQSGHSLFSDIHPNRWILAMNTGSIRSWSREGFGLINGTTRFIFTQAAPPELYDVSNDREQLRNIWQPSLPVAVDVQQLIEKTPALKRIVEGRDNP
jgi:hypothetical protein